MQLKNVPLLVLANKQDLSGSLEPSEIAEGLSLLSLRHRAWQIEGAVPIGVGMVWCMARRHATLLRWMDNSYIGLCLSRPMYRMFRQGWYWIGPWYELVVAADHSEVDCRWLERLQYFLGACETVVHYEVSIVILTNNTPISHGLHM